MTRIYTRAGDAGETSLGDGSRVPKTDPRIEAYGAVDELNSLLGLVLAGELPAEFRPWLEQVHNDLFDLGADLSVPLEDERERLRVTTEQVERLEELCDLVNEELEPLKSFILPGGTESAARLHVARSVCRRAERLAVDLAAKSSVNPAAPRARAVSTAAAPVSAPRGRSTSDPDSTTSSLNAKESTIPTPPLPVRACRMGTRKILRPAEASTFTASTTAKPTPTPAA